MDSNLPKRVVYVCTLLSACTCDSDDRMFCINSRRREVDAADDDDDDVDED
jgi:hypothetical protein